ncbi:MAG TPA: SH3 domain-containing protein [Planococcus sp. (in: firmicutes)]|nr:SH3 domain-containing protein [Planococcus sp. (in: firmicutes)]
MKAKWSIGLILLFLMIAGTIPPLTANPALAVGGEAEITGSTVNIRSGPGLSYSVSGALEKGEKVTIVAESGDWLEISSGSGTGWIASWLARKTGSTGTNAASGQTAVAAVDSLNIRAQADISASVLAQMSAGDQALIVSDAGSWLEIDFRGVKGFVSKQYISSAGQTQEKPAPAKSDVSSFEIAVDALNVRKQPDLSSAIQKTVKKGEVFPVQSIQGNWVEIQISGKESGWVYAFHGHMSDKPAEKAASPKSETITIVTDGTNLRTGPSTASGVAYRADAGKAFTIVDKQGDWYEVSLPDGQNAFVADWVVRNSETKVQTAEAPEQQARKKGTLSGLTIVLDPGHGGNDGGTVGVRETKEKDLTLKTSEILSHHLRSAGAEVLLTRQSDVYVDLRTRVSTGHQVAADAFISLHYDATDDNSVSGFTSYYTLDYQQSLAESINDGLSSKIDLRNRGARHGNYLVLRENKQAAVLIELGYLSNYNDERIVTSSKFQEQAALGLYSGIVNYFDAKLGE